MLVAVVSQAQITLPGFTPTSFPVTETTVFHAQYGRFIQTPELNDMYSGPFDYNNYLTMEPQNGFNGGLVSEETTQYEIAPAAKISDRTQPG